MGYDERLHRTKELREDPYEIEKFGLANEHQPQGKIERKLNELYEIAGIESILEIEKILQDNTIIRLRGDAQWEKGNKLEAVKTWLKMEEYYSSRWRIIQEFASRNESLLVSENPGIMSDIQHIFGRDYNALMTAILVNDESRIKKYFDKGVDSLIDCNLHSANLIKITEFLKQNNYNDLLKKVKNEVIPKLLHPERIYEYKYITPLIILGIIKQLDEPELENDAYQILENVVNDKCKKYEYNNITEEREELKEKLNTFKKLVIQKADLKTLIDNWPKEPYEKLRVSDILNKIISAPLDFDYIYRELRC